MEKTALEDPSDVMGTLDDAQTYFFNISRANQQSRFLGGGAGGFPPPLWFFISVVNFLAKSLNLKKNHRDRHHRAAKRGNNFFFSVVKFYVDELVEASSLEASSLAGSTSVIAAFKTSILEPSTILRTTV